MKESIDLAGAVVPRKYCGACSRNTAAASRCQSPEFLNVEPAAAHPDVPADCPATKPSQLWRDCPSQRRRFHPPVHGQTAHSSWHKRWAASPRPPRSLQLAWQWGSNAHCTPHCVRHILSAHQYQVAVGAHGSRHLPLLCGCSTTTGLQCPAGLHCNRCGCRGCHWGRGPRVGNVAARPTISVGCRCGAHDHHMVHKLPPAPHEPLKSAVLGPHKPRCYHRHQHLRLWVHGAHHLPRRSRNGAEQMQGGVVRISSCAQRKMV